MWDDILQTLAATVLILATILTAVAIGRPLVAWILGG